jgi:hypothetical protein
MDPLSGSVLVLMLANGLVIRAHSSFLKRDDIGKPVRIPPSANGYRLSVQVAKVVYYRVPVYVCGQVHEVCGDHG